MGSLGDASILTFSSDSAQLTNVWQPTTASGNSSAFVAIKPTATALAVIIKSKT
jgi:hypothetical protein